MAAVTLTNFKDSSPSFGDWVGGVLGARFPMNISDIQPEFVIQTSTQSGAEIEPEDPGSTRKFGRNLDYHQMYHHQNVGILTPVSPGQSPQYPATTAYDQYGPIQEITQNLVPQARSFPTDSNFYANSAGKPSPSPVYYPKG